MRRVPLTPARCSAGEDGHTAHSDRRTAAVTCRVVGPGRRVAGVDDGSLIPLLAFFAALAAVVALLLAAATSLYLERQRLFTIADGAALAAAESFMLDDVVVTGENVTARLSTSRVRTVAEGYVQALPVTALGSRLGDLALTRASTDGRQAVVALRVTWHPPLAALLVPEGLALTATSSARAFFG